MHNINAVAALLALTSWLTTAMAKPPAVGYSNGLTEEFKLFFDKNEERIRARLDSYEEIDVELLRLHAFPGGGAGRSPYLRVLEDYDFRVRMILYSLPNQQLQDQNGVTRGKTINFWTPDGNEKMLAKTRGLIRQLKASPVWQRIDYLIPSLGPAGELTYLPTWTTGMPEMTFWCYGPHAQASFRAQMQKRYGELDAANKVWGTKFETWSAVHVPKPGTHPGTFWNDVLTWYRDSKREFARWQIRETQKLSDKQLVLYIPGQHYTQAQWDQSVATGGKQSATAIKMMLDSDFLIQLGKEFDCDLQYTGLSRAESLYIAKRAREIGFTGKIFGENAGSYGPASSPAGLATIIREAGFDGIDYTASQFLWEKDLRTRSPLHRELGDAFITLKGREAPQRWTKLPSPTKSADGALWTFVAEPGEKRGLHAMWAGNHAPPSVERDGRKGWHIEPDNPERHHVYFSVQHPDLGMGKTPRVDLAIEYFSEGEGTLVLDYDSSDESVRKVAGAPGAFKRFPEKIELTPDGSWKVAVLRLEDALFANRCNARDFRLSLGEGASFVLRSVTLLDQQKTE